MAKVWREGGGMGGILHDGKNDIGFILDAVERDRSDHHDHEVEDPVCTSEKFVRSHPEDSADYIWTNLVASAFVGARIRSGTISAGYSHVIPSQPMAKKVLKTKRKTAWPTPAPLSL